eukprot:c4771_g1_i2.p2 GENE.c4771_g1_i2~~c4771_g1_i2.p2  ORF type:complete len:124 (-),score=28.92 c4771_g1_i2:17-388(-)
MLVRCVPNLLRLTDSFELLVEFDEQIDSDATWQVVFVLDCANERQEVVLVEGTPEIDTSNHCHAKLTVPCERLVSSPNHILNNCGELYVRMTSSAATSIPLRLLTRISHSPDTILQLQIFDQA